MKLDLKRANCDLVEFTPRQKTQVNFFSQSVHVGEHIIPQVPINAQTGKVAASTQVIFRAVGEYTVVSFVGLASPAHGWIPSAPLPEEP